MCSCPYVKKENFAGRYLDPDKNARNKITHGSPSEFRF